MASDAGEIFDEHGGDAMAIAELLVWERNTSRRLRDELDALMPAPDDVRVILGMNMEITSQVRYPSGTRQFTCKPVPADERLA